MDIHSRDSKVFGDYVSGHTSSIAQAGGCFLAAGAPVESIEGNLLPRTMVIHQLPNAQAFLT